MSSPAFAQPTGQDPAKRVSNRLAQVAGAQFGTKLTEAQYTALTRFARRLPGGEYLQNGTLTPHEAEALGRAIKLETAFDKIEVFVLPGKKAQIMCIGSIQASDQTHYFYLDAGRSKPSADVAAKHKRSEARKAWWAEYKGNVIFLLIVIALFAAPVALSLMVSPGAVILLLASVVIVLVMTIQFTDRHWFSDGVERSIRSW